MECDQMIINPLTTNEHICVMTLVNSP